MALNGSHIRRFVASAFVAGAIAPLAQAQSTFPSHTVRIVVP